MTKEMRQFLMRVQYALHDLAQSNDLKEYRKLQDYIAAKGLEGVDVDEIVERRLL